MKIECGERFELPEESIAGVVTDVFCDDDGETFAIVVHMDDGRWASVVTSGLERISVH